MFLAQALTLHSAADAFPSWMRLHGALPILARCWFDHRFLQTGASPGRRVARRLLCAAGQPLDECGYVMEPPQSVEIVPPKSVDAVIGLSATGHSSAEAL